MKNVLVIYYSQSGQLKEIADKISLPFVEDANVNVTYYNIQTKKNFPFPWDNDSFFDVFPKLLNRFQQKSFHQVTKSFKQNSIWFCCIFKFGICRHQFQ